MYFNLCANVFSPQLLQISEGEGVVGDRATNENEEGRPSNRMHACIVCNCQPFHMRMHSNGNY